MAPSSPALRSDTPSAAPRLMLGTEGAWLPPVESRPLRVPRACTSAVPALVETFLPMLARVMEAEAAAEMVASVAACVTSLRIEKAEREAERKVAAAYESGKAEAPQELRTQVERLGEYLSKLAPLAQKQREDRARAEGVESGKVPSLLVDYEEAARLTGRTVNALTKAKQAGKIPQRCIHYEGKAVWFVRAHLMKWAEGR